MTGFSSPRTWTLIGLHVYKKSPTLSQAWQALSTVNVTRVLSWGICHDLSGEHLTPHISALTGHGRSKTSCFLPGCSQCEGLWHFRYLSSPLSRSITLFYSPLSLSHCLYFLHTLFLSLSFLACLKSFNYTVAQFSPIFFAFDILVSISPSLSAQSLFHLHLRHLSASNWGRGGWEGPSLCNKLLTGRWIGGEAEENAEMDLTMPLIISLNVITSSHSFGSSRGARALDDEHCREAFAFSSLPDGELLLSASEPLMMTTVIICSPLDSDANC